MSLAPRQRYRVARLREVLHYNFSLKSGSEFTCRGPQNVECRLAENLAICECFDRVLPRTEKVEVIEQTKTII